MIPGKRGFALLPVLIILASVLIGTGSVLLLREKMESASPSGEIVLNTNNSESSSQEETSSFPDSDGSENTNNTSFSSPLSEEVPNNLETESTDANYLTASDFKDLNKISYLSDTISNDELEDSKISLVGESGDFVDNLHLGETLKIQGGEGIDTEVLNNEVVVSGEDASVSNKGIAKYTDAQFTVTDGNVEIRDIYVKNTGDSIDGDLVLNGNLNANGNVVVRDDATINGNLTGNKGLSVSGGNINLNVSSNYPTNINTGTSTGNISLGSGSNSISFDSSDWDISGVGKLTGISGIDNDGYYTQTGTDANTFTGVTTFSNPTYSALFTGGNVGIGTSEPNSLYKLNVRNELIDSGGRGLQVDQYSTTTLNGTRNISAVVASNINQAIASGVVDSGYRYGVWAENYNYSTDFAGTLNTQAAIVGNAGILRGVSGATINNVYGGKFSIFNRTSGTTIDNAYGVYIGNSETVGTISNRYDLYASSTNANNYFAGNVGIGTTNPTALLHVTGTTLFQNSANAVNSYQFNNATGISVMSVDTTNGRVGIGTTAPNKILDIRGTSPYIGLVDTDGDQTRWVIGNRDSQKLQIWEENSGQYHMTILKTSGNVGIGTTAPAQKLHVDGSSYATGTIGVGTTPDSSRAIKSQISLTNTSNQSGINSSTNSVSNSNGTYYLFGGQFYGKDTVSLDVTNSGYVMGLDASGYLNGAGNIATTYGARLDTGTFSGGTGTVNNSYGAMIRLLNAGNGTVTNAYGVNITSNSYSGTIVNAYGVYIGDMAGSTRQYGIFQDSNSDLNYFAGNVGIGTTTPEAKLNVVLDTNNVDIIRASTAAHSVGLGVDSASIYWGASIFQDGTKRFTVESNYGLLVGSSYQSSAAPSNGAIIEGNVGIGVSAPTYKLQLNGQPAANGYTAWTNYSDSRLKENITPLVNGSVLDKISQLNPVTFNYNSLTGYDAETRARRVSGFIAQELQQVFPEMVGETTINGKKYLDTNTSNLQLYMLEGIQELAVQTSSINNNWVMQNGQIKIISLEDQIAELNNEWVINNGEDEIEQLKARVAELENSKIQETIDQTISNDSNSNDNVSATNENVNENLNSNDNAAIDPAVVLPEADKSANSNDNLNIDQKINDQLSLLGIGDIGGTVTAFFKEVWFEAKVTFEKAVVFAAEVTFGGRVTFQDQDMGGKTVIESGTDSVTVTFAKPFNQEPIITATASNLDVSFGVKDRSASGFTIYLKAPTTENQEFSWIALPIEEKRE